MENRANSAPDNSDRVAAVVVTYNRKELLLECISALMSQTKAGILDVIVIDNASTDGTGDAVRSIDVHSCSAGLSYLNTGANLGGAGGFSFGMREATERGYGWVWVMDDDCIPNPSALENFFLAESAIGEPYGFLSSKVLWKDGSLCKMNLQRERVFRPVRDFSRNLIPVEMASFVSLFVPTKNIIKYGLPIREFFIWTDDWEFTRRLSRELPCYLVPGSVVVHKSADNTGADIASSDASRLNRFGYLYRNDVVLYRREGLSGLAYEVVRLTSHVARVLTRAKDHRLERISQIITGTAKGLRFHPEIEYPILGRPER